MTELKVDIPSQNDTRVTIGELSDGTFFDYQGVLYVKNTFRDADAFSVCGGYGLNRGDYNDSFPDRVFKTAEITLS